MKYCLSIMMRMYFTRWSSTAKAWFLLKSTIISCDKKLLIIIRCFKHWWLKLKCTELLIQIFINHQALKIFMKNKQLSWRQVNYLNILSKFNFQIIFRSGKMNIKVDALTRMSLANVSESAKRFKDHFQTILTSDRVDILPIDSKSSANSKSEVNLY